MCEAIPSCGHLRKCQALLSCELQDLMSQVHSIHVIHARLNIINVLLG